MHVGELADRGRVEEELKELMRVVDRPPLYRQGRLHEVFHRGTEPCCLRRVWSRPAAGKGGHQGAREHDFEALLRDREEPEFLRNHLPLLGDLDPTLDRIAGQRLERAEHGGPPAAPHGAAATVKQHERDPGLTADPSQFFLTSVQGP